MKQISGFILLLVFVVSCNSNASKEFSPKTSEEIRTDLTSFIENHNWQKDGKESWPLISITATELARLKSAWSETGPRHEILAKRFERVDKALTDTLYFPPEGGQHNQWYQCTDCQIALKTVDAHHHKCPQCGKVYSGFPYDNVLYGRQHSRNFSLAEDAAWAWAVKGDKKYAELAAGILEGYADRYLKYPMVHADAGDKSIDVAAQKNGRYRTAGHIMEQTLNESMLMIPCVTAYDLIYNSGVMQQGAKKHIEDDLIRAMADCINVYKSGKSNWQTWHNSALFYAGIVLGDKTMVKQAFLDEENGFMTQMKISVLPEGMWYENSWGYHYYTLSALTIMAEGARRLGIDIYSHEMLQKMYLIAFRYLMADGSLPRFGDAVNDTPDNPDVNEPAYAVYKDKRLLSTLPSEYTWDMIIAGRQPGEKAERPHSVSNLVHGSGHAILSTDGPGKLTAAFTFGPYGGFHGHFDKLSFVFFGYGKELGVDPGRSASQAYRLPIHREWYKATTGHNVVLVDGKSQNEAEGKLLSFVATENYAAVAADAGPAFDSINHRRFLLLGPTYLLVVDELKASDGKEHTFDWLYHNKGQSSTCGLTNIIEKPGDLPPGYSYLKDIKAFRTEPAQSLEVNFADENITTRLVMISSEGDKLFTASGPFSSVVDRAQMAIVRRKGKNVRFITILEPIQHNNQPDIKSVSVVKDEPLSIKVTRQGGDDLISFENESLGNYIVTSKSGSSSESVLLKAKTETSGENQKVK